MTELSDYSGSHAGGKASQFLNGSQDSKAALAAVQNQYLAFRL